MLESFKKIKKKYVMTAAILCAVIGISFGLLAMGAVMLGLKLGGIRLHPGLYALIAIGGALIVGGGTFLAAYPSDARIAKRLDEEYGLQERVRTALAFSKDDGDIARAQRQDTEARLSTLKLKKPSAKKIFTTVVVGILALAMTITAIAIPAKAAGGGSSSQDGPPPIDDSFALSDIQKAAIESLISDVESVSLDEALKADVCAALSALLDELEAASKLGEMREAVVKCMRTADSLAKGACTYYGVGSALLAAGSIRPAAAIAYGAETYNPLTIGDVTALENFFADSVESTEIAIGATLETMRDELNGFLSDGDTASVDEFRDNLRVGLRNAEAECALKQIFAKFGQDIEGDLTANSLAVAVDGLAYSLSYELAGQACTLAVCKYVQTKLLEQFDVPQNMITFAAWDLTREVESQSGESDDKEHGGGYGDGEQTYGSNDEVYDPLTGEYVPYGQLLQKYYDIVQSLLNEGQLTEEEAAAVRDYFSLLFGALDSKN